MPGDLTTLPNVKQWLAVSGLLVASVTNANPAVLTLVSVPQTPLLNGGTYDIEGSIGAVGIDGSWVISVLAPNQFSIPFDATAAGTYTGGAVVGVNDSLLSRLISAASTFMQKWMSNVIALTTYNETRNGVGGIRMMTLNAPIASVSSVTINGNVIPPRPPLGPGSTTYPGGWVNDDVSIMVTGWEFCRGMQNINIVYSSGYATTPPDLEQACIDIIGDWFKYRERIGKVSEGIEGQTIMFTNAQIPPRALAIMNTYNTKYPAF